MNPSLQALLAGAASSDPYLLSVVLGLHADGANNSTTFTDTTGKTVTPSGDAKISTAQSKFGGSSALFDGSGDWLTVANSSAWDFAAGDFTIEAWVYQTVRGANHNSLVSKWGPSNNASFRWLILSTGLLNFGFLDSGLTNYGPTSSGTIPLNTWTHCAVSRNGTTVSFYINGVQDGTATISATMRTSTAGLSIGRNEDQNTWFFNGHMDDIRITKGVGRYTANFTPPAAPFP